MINIMIRYLGIKTKLLEPIKLAIKNVTGAHAGVLDLFAGSNTVAQSLMDNYVVYTNDYQKYSFVAAKALIEYHTANLVESLSEDQIFGEYYIQNKSELSHRFREPLEAEVELLKNIKDTYHGNDFDAFTMYFEHTPYAGHTDNAHNSFKNCLKYYSEEEIEEYRRNPKRFPYSLFTLYYANPYFSLEQCIEIDSIKYSIDQLLANRIITEETHSIYSSFLIYCLNLIVISVGDHFAQPQKIKNVSDDLSGERDKINLRERKKIILKKRTKVKELFIEKLNDYKTHYNQGSTNNKAFNYDFKELLQNPLIDTLNISTVYIDPPYTNAHYSRFYHIPETLVTYDYPEIEFAGRYRTDRYQSNFCIKTHAYSEFELMLKLCKQKGLNAVISYSDTSQCILTIKEICEISKKYYSNNVIVTNIEHMYRNFGQKPNRVLAKEYLITCYN